MKERTKITEDELKFVIKLHNTIKGYEKYMIEKGLSDKEPDNKDSYKQVSQMLGVTKPTLEQMLAYNQGINISFDTLKNIRSLREIFSILEDTLNKEAVYQFLGGHNQYLRRKQPIEFLIKRDYDKIRDVAANLKYHAFP